MASPWPLSSASKPGKAPGGDEEVKDVIFPIRAHGGMDIGKMSIDDFTQFLKKKTIETIKDF